LTLPTTICPAASATSIDSVPSTNESALSAGTRCRSEVARESTPSVCATLGNVAPDDIQRNMRMVGTLQMDLLVTASIGGTGTASPVDWTSRRPTMVSSQNRGKLTTPSNDAGVRNAANCSTSTVKAAATRNHAVCGGVRMKTFRGRQNAGQEGTP
jgi:hypothetical protein